MLKYIIDIKIPLQNPLQFAYRANMLADEAFNLELHFISHILILFVDFSLAFNTVSPDILHPKLAQLPVPVSSCQWITRFLTEWQQEERLGSVFSHT